MSDEMLALLWTIGVFLFMGAWIALMESAKYLLSRRLASKSDTARLGDRYPVRELARGSEN
jgi:hypothetical protein